MAKNGSRSRPSDSRREKLRRGEPSSLKDLHNNLLPIERYYEIADKLFSMFEDAHQAGDIDKAYIFGKRASVFCGELLPTHPYYKSSRENLKILRNQNLSNLQNVATTLEIIVDIMDEQEIEREEEEKRKQLEKEEEEKRKQIALENAAREQILMRQRKLENVKKSANKNILSKDQLQLQVEEKLRLLALNKPSTDSSPEFEEKKSKRRSKPPVEQTQERELDLSDQPITTDNNDWPNIPVIPVPSDEPIDESVNIDASSPWARSPSSISPTPPSYDAAINTRVRNESEVSSSGSWLNDEWSKSSLVKKEEKTPSPKDDIIPIKELRMLHNQEFEALKIQKKVEIFVLSTYQGRCKNPGQDSTNGCTVISPLIAIEYLCGSSPGMADSTIEEVIDEKAPPILVAVRSKFGLPNDALIIPSDAHDYLVDIKLLRQEMFVGVCGGNIMDPLHLTELLNMLKNGSSSDETEEKKNSTKKVAAALFFHEHVVSILKINVPNGDSWYDLIDSMPKISYGRQGGTRTRCKDIQTLEITLLAYACSKFTEPNCMYIDNNMWDDILCDFDPRVFQAFVWAS